MEPMNQGSRADWNSEVDSVNLHLEGSKTDWLNRGTVRSHGRLEPGGPNEEICLVRKLQVLFRMFPERATKTSIYLSLGGGMAA